jgi:hypothetical protein
MSKIFADGLFGQDPRRQADGAQECLQMSRWKSDDEALDLTVGDTLEVVDQKVNVRVGDKSFSPIEGRECLHREREKICAD